MNTKKALVTGGTRGLGYAIAEQLKKAGYAVTVTGTSLQGSGPKGTTYIACDFADPKAVAGLSSKISTMDLSVLVNNAGINKPGPMESYDPAEFERIQQVNVTAPWLLCRAVVSGMRKRKFGRIVNITSIYGVVSRDGRSAYSASKFALFGLTRALALETAADNVLANCLAPGFVDTDLTRQVLGAKGMADMAKKVPMGRLAKPEELAGYAVFLAGEQNTYMTGQNVVVDGGFTSA